MRTCVDRLAKDGSTTVGEEMKESGLRGLHSLTVRNKQGDKFTAVLELRFRRMVVRPPIGKQKDYPELVLTAIYAAERNAPKDREKINWKLLTDLPVRSCLDAIEKLEWYSQRWKIETFHKILKSGCRAEEAKLRTAERLVNLIAILTILSWRIFWITMLNRTRPDASPAEAFTDLDQYLLDELVPNKSAPPSTPRWDTISSSSLDLAVTSPAPMIRRREIPLSGEAVTVNGHRTGHHDRSKTCG